MTYDHTQRMPFHRALLGLAIGLALLFIAIAVVATATSGGPVIILVSVLATMWVWVILVQYLRVRDEGDCLVVRFGPLPIFRRRILYSQITGAEAGRSWLLEGWGIHWMPGRGWLYNLWGLDCVVIHLGAKKKVRIGTDDVDGLVEFLKAKIGVTA